MALRVTVFAEPTLNVINAVDEATSGYGLGQFLDLQVQPYLAREIIERFSVEGDEKSGSWAPLKEGTQAIRSELGYPPEGPINERTGELLKSLIEDYDLEVIENSAILQVPGNEPQEIEDKLQTAQMGRDPNPIPYFGPTPPRPVLAVDESDLEALLLLLRNQIITFVATKAMF
jgi:hypothetical protein